MVDDAMTRWLEALAVSTAQRSECDAHYSHRSLCILQSSLIFKRRYMQLEVIGGLYAPGSDPHAVQIHLLGPGHFIAACHGTVSHLFHAFLSGFRCIYLWASGWCTWLPWVAWGALVQRSWAKASWSQYFPTLT